MRTARTGECADGNSAGGGTSTSGAVTTVWNTENKDSM